MAVDNPILFVTSLVLYLFVPVQCLLVATIWRNRTDSILKQPFFKLLMSAVTNDVFFCIVCAPIYIWYSLGGYRSHPRLLPTLMYSIPPAFYHSSLLALTAIAVNRGLYLVTKVPGKYWTEKTTKLCLVAHWVGGIVCGLKYIHPDGQFGYIDGVIRMVSPNSTAAKLGKLHTVVVFSVCVSLIFISYTACLFKLIYHRLTVKTGSISFEREAKLFVQAVILSFCVLGMSVSVFAFLFVCGAKYCSGTHAMLNWGFTITNFYSTAPLAFLLSPILRKHAKLLCKRSNEVQAIGTAGP